MKKIYIFAAVLALLTLSLNAQMQAKKKVATQQATSTEKVDVPFEGILKVSKPAAKRAPSRATETATISLFDTTRYVAQVLPVYGYWYDAAQHNQMIYPASMLTDMAGKKITSMTFFPATYTNSGTTYSGINFYNGTVTFKLMEVNNSSGFASSSPSYITGTMTTVKTVSMPSTANTSATTWLIEFDQAYEYNGGDLVIDVTTTAGNYAYTYFYIGTTSSLGVAYPGLLQYSSNSAQSIGYVPAVDFTYEYDAEPQHDLGVALSAPATAGAGSTVNVTATVTNNGDFAENGYTVTVTDGTNNVTITATEELPVGQSAEFTVQFTTSTNAGGQTVNYTATVACTDDAVASNNTATASTTLKTCPPPENVAATASGQSGTMTWDAPTIPSTLESYSWDFEQASQFNDWTLVNADGDSYNWTYNTYVEGSSASVFEPHSGTGYIVSASYINNVGALTPDNWLISPEVTLGGTLTFWAKGTDTNDYAENFGVFVYQGAYSSGTSGFVQVGVDQTTTSGWVKYTFDLSQYSGQGRIAIRHYNCTNMYFLEVDDIEYQVTVPGEQPTSYNIYLEGQLVGNVDANTFSYTFNNLSDGTYNCAVSAVYSYGESVAVPTTFTIESDPDKTPAPVIDYSVEGEYVTITATGNGTVTLNVPGYEPATGEGEASITIPRGVVDITLTATATAQEDGKEESDPASREITIPAGSDWTEMDGTYDNPNDLLSFLKDGEDIALLDQFRVSTLNNDHPDHYTYTLRQTVNGETQTSTPVPIPVYKTNSTMKGFYTYDQVTNVDKNMSLRDGVINSEMDYDVAISEHMYYYGLFRGDMNADYPVINNQHRVSQLQQYNEKEGEQVLHYFTETYLTGIAPRYDNIGNQQVALLDTNYVVGGFNDELAYVPVIWTYGLSTARGDGKDNTYGSDIKRETLGKVEAKISGETTAGNTYGTWKVGETEYCVFHPTIDVTGTLPQLGEQIHYNDGDIATYEPYLCRAWCTYEGIHDFVRNSDGNLEDHGELQVPYWLGDATFNNSLEASIGGEWTGGNVRDQWSFGLPSSVDPSEVTYIIRFYYKKVVTDAQAQQSGSKLRDGNDSAEYFIVQTGGEYGEWVVGINELNNGIVPVDVTYVNPQGMQSSRPFDGVNIVVTRYSDGSTRTTKIIR